MKEHLSVGGRGDGKGATRAKILSKAKKKGPPLPGGATKKPPLPAKKKPPLPKK